MKTMEVKVARIGNSRGIRIPISTLRRYRIGEAIIMEERSDGILLRPVGPSVEKLSWEATAGEMAIAEEDWSDWDATAGDGLGNLPWDSADMPQVAERRARYDSTSRSSGKK